MSSPPQLPASLCREGADDLVTQVAGSSCDVTAFADHRLCPLYIPAVNIINKLQEHVPTISQLERSLEHFHHDIINAACDVTWFLRRLATVL